jgi:hypothetical protein
MYEHSTSVVASVSNRMCSGISGFFVRQPVLSSCASRALPLSHLSHTQGTLSFSLSLLQIFHPNVHFRTGGICLDILKKEWSPAWGSARERPAGAVCALLSDPDADPPLNCDAGNMVRGGHLVACLDSAAVYTMENAQFVLGRQWRESRRQHRRRAATASRTRNDSLEGGDLQLSTCSSSIIIAHVLKVNPYYEYSVRHFCSRDRPIRCTLHR